MIFSKSPISALMFISKNDTARLKEGAMKHKLVVVLLVAVFLASSAAFADDGQVLAMPNRHLTLTYQSLAMDAPIPTAIPITSRRRAASSSNAPTFLDGALDYSYETGALSRTFTHFPIGAVVHYRVLQPDQTVVLDRAGLVDHVQPEDSAMVSSNQVGSAWNDPLSANSPTGVWTFQTVAYAYGQVYTMDRFVPWKMSPSELEKAGPLGPLYSATEDASGGIFLDALTTTKPTVVSMFRVGKLRMQADNYVAPGEVSQFPALITECTGFHGDPKHLWCGTVATRK